MKDKCPKCHDEDIKLKYCKGEKFLIFITGQEIIICDKNYEHLHISCEKCSYEWIGDCLDA